MTQGFDIAAIRARFPALNREMEDGRPPVFLDGPGGSQVPATVIEAMGAYLAGGNSNLLNSPFFAVQKTHEVVGRARTGAAALLNVAPENIIFGANMSTLTAQISRAISRDWQAGDEIIVTALDHSANVSFWCHAAQDKGVTCHLARLRPEDCTLDHDHLESLISEKTRLVAFSLASNVCGSLSDAARIIRAAKAVGAMTYVDAVHYVPHFLPDARALDCDFMACSAYKFFGPHLGMVYGKSEHLTRLRPYKVEPASEQPPERWESGTKSFEALAGFGATIDYLSSLNKKKMLRDSLQASYEMISAHEAQWATQFLKRAASIPRLKIWGITDPEKTDRRTATFALTLGVHTPQAFSDHLAAQNIAAGAGNFYGVGVTDALGLTQKGGVVRVGALHYNTFGEMDRLFTAIEALS
jgi:cysteine desulfurase family protein (TIGR01976 family)